MSFSRGGQYNSGCVSFQKDIVLVNKRTDTLNLPYYFTFLYISELKYFSRKSWVFHMGISGELGVFSPKSDNNKYNIYFNCRV